MRKPLLIAPIVLALGTPLTAPAQDAPRVLFCAGGCFAVDAEGIRTAAPKGTVLQPHQRLETAAGGYVQVKLSPEAAIGIGEQGRIRFERGAVILDQGRLRMVGGEAFGKPITQPIELRTTDGTLVLRGADLEVKKTGFGAAATPTLVKLNAGDARLGKGPGEIRLPTQAVRGITIGKLAGAPIPITDILPPQPREPREPSATHARTPVAMPTAPIIVPTTFVQQPILIDTALTRTLSTTFSPTLTQIDTKPAVTSADTLLNTQLVSPDTGTLVKVTDVLKAPETLQPVIYEAPKAIDTSTSTKLSAQQTQVETCSRCTQYQFQTVK